MSKWLPIETAPKDGTWVDLWGSDRDPTPGAGGILLPIEWRRYTDCLWHAPPRRLASGLIMPREAGWYMVVNLGLSPEFEYQRIWPTHWMPVPGRPEDGP